MQCQHLDLYSPHYLFYSEFNLDRVSVRVVSALVKFFARLMLKLESAVLPSEFPNICSKFSSQALVVRDGPDECS